MKRSTTLQAAVDICQTYETANTDTAALEISAPKPSVLRTFRDNKRRPHKPENKDRQRNHLKPANIAKARMATSANTVPPSAMILITAAKETTYLACVEASLGTTRASAELSAGSDEKIRRKSPSIACTFVSVATKNEGRTIEAIPDSGADVSCTGFRHMRLLGILPSGSYQAQESAHSCCRRKQATRMCWLFSYQTPCP